MCYLLVAPLFLSDLGNPSQALTDKAGREVKAAFPGGFPLSSCEDFLESENYRKRGRESECETDVTESWMLLLCLLLLLLFMNGAKGVFLLL